MPSDPVSVAVALADKIDTLCGFWAIDEKPTGSKDPFALRRAALGVIRLVLGNGVRVSLSLLIDFSTERHFRKSQNAYHLVFKQEDGSFEVPHCWQEFGVLSFDENGRTVGEWQSEAQFDVERPTFYDPDFEIVQPVLGGIDYMRSNDVQLGQNRIQLRSSVRRYDLASKKDLLAFLHDRLKVTLREQSIPHDVIDACLAMPGNDDLTLVTKRATALAATLKTDDGTNLLQGVKRATNILTQAETKDGVEYSYGADPKFAETDAERALFAALDHAEPLITAAMKTEDFATAMAAMATLRAPIDGFFQSVQVNTDNQITRRNRLNLLHRIRTLCAGVADLTKIEG